MVRTNYRHEMINYNNIIIVDVSRIYIWDTITLYYSKNQVWYFINSRWLKCCPWKKNVLSGEEQNDLETTKLCASVTHLKIKQMFSGILLPVWIHGYTVSMPLNAQSVSSQIKMREGVWVFLRHNLHWVASDLKLTFGPNRRMCTYRRHAFSHVDAVVTLWMENCWVEL